MSRSEEELSPILEPELLKEIIKWTLFYSQVSYLPYILNLVVSQIEVLPNERELVVLQIKKILREMMSQIEADIQNNLRGMKAREEIVMHFNKEQKIYFDFDFDFDSIFFDFFHSIDHEEILGSFQKNKKTKEKDNTEQKPSITKLIEAYKNTRKTKAESNAEKEIETDFMPALEDVNSLLSKTESEFHNEEGAPVREGEEDIEEMLYKIFEDNSDSTLVSQETEDELGEISQNEEEDFVADLSAYFEE